MSEDIFDPDPGVQEEFRSYMADPSARAAFVEVKARKAEQGARVRYQHILKLVSETPWAIRPNVLGVIVDLLAFRAEGGRLEPSEIAERIGAARQGPPSGQGGVAILPLHGVIVPKAGLMSDVSGASSIEKFRSMFRQAMASSEVSAIVMDVDSPGGMVDQVPEMAAEIRASRGPKPIVAIANTEMSSAAYWLGAQADQLVVSKSARVGSIGVFTAHEDRSKEEEIAGIKTTLISAGKYKTEGNPFAPLSAEAKSTLQGLVDDYYGMFVSDVAKGRGVNVADVREGFGQGRVVGARDALTQGMADEAGSLEGIVGALLRQQAVGSRAASHLGTAYVDVVPRIVGVVADVQFGASAIPVHHTDTYGDAWDGPANEARLNSGDEANLRKANAWYDPNGADPNGDGYPDAKSDYRFIHHTVAADGTAAGANTNACSSAIGVLNGGRGVDHMHQPWTPDRAGIHRHLAAHLVDAGVKSTDVPQLSLSLEPVNGEPLMREPDEVLMNEAAIAALRERPK